MYHIAIATSVAASRAARALPAFAIALLASSSTQDIKRTTVIAITPLANSSIENGQRTAAFAAALLTEAA